MLQPLTPSPCPLPTSDSLDLSHTPVLFLSPSLQPGEERCVLAGTIWAPEGPSAVSSCLRHKEEPLAFVSESLGGKEEREVSTIVHPDKVPSGL